MVAGDVESVKEIGSETDEVFAPYMEVLEQGQVDLPEAWAAFRAIASSTERARQCGSVSTNPIVWAIAANRRGISSPPVLHRAVADDQATVMVCATEAPSSVVGIAGIRAEDGDGKSRINQGRGCYFPSSKRRVKEPIRIAAVSLTATEG